MLLARADDKVFVTLCGESCTLAPMLGIPCNAEFAGMSKGHNLGIRFGEHFFVERLAEDWDGERHDFRITIKRGDTVKDGVVLRTLATIRHNNLLAVRDFCSCAVKLDYVEGLHLSRSVGPWILGPYAQREDFLCHCSPRVAISLVTRISSVLTTLHCHGIAHTDPTAHNVIVRKHDGEPVLMDLVGCMQLTETLRAHDIRVFRDHLVIPTLRRLGVDYAGSCESLDRIRSELARLLVACRDVARIGD